MGSLFTIEGLPVWIIVIAIIGGIVIGHLAGKLLSVGLTIVAFGFLVAVLVAYNAGTPLPDALEAGLDWLAQLWQTIKPED